MKTKQVTIEGWIVFDKFQASMPHIFDSPYRFRGYKPDDKDENVAVQPHTIVVDIPEDFDPRPQMVKALEAQKEKARDEFAAKVVELDRQINQLLAIEG